MLKILQARIQQYMNWELPDIQVGFRKSRGSRDQIANICWMIKKKKKKSKRIPEKNIYLCFIDYAKVFDWVDHNRLQKIFKKMVIPDDPTCCQRNLYAVQEATFRTGCGTWTGSKLGRSTSRLNIVTLLI